MNKQGRSRLILLSYSGMGKGKMSLQQVRELSPVITGVGELDLSLTGCITQETGCAPCPGSTIELTLLVVAHVIRLRAWQKESWPHPSCMPCCGMGERMMPSPLCPLLLVTGEGVEPGITSVGKLTLLLSSYSTQDSG